MNVPRTARRGTVKPLKTYHWWQPLLFAVIAGASFSVAYTILSLIIHGTVKWW